MDRVITRGPFWEDEPPSWFVRNRKSILVILGSLIVHLIAGGTLSKFSEYKEQTLAERLRQQETHEAVEFEFTETQPAAKAKRQQPATARQEPAPSEPKKANQTKIVELPEEPEQAPIDPKYLAERDMRAEKETIAKRIGEAENRTEEGVSNGAASAKALPQDKVKAKPAVKAESGAEGPADKGDGAAKKEQKQQTVARLPDAGIADQGGGVPVPGATAPELRESMEKGGGKQNASPKTTGQKSLLPSNQRLAKLIEPAQRNLIQSQHGDITLLNARSSELAAYVLARAKRIYSFLNINGPLLTVYYEDVENLRFPVAMEASINRRGEVLQVATIVSSGSRKIDNLVSDATRSGLHGQEAPPEDGFIDGEKMRFRFALYTDHIEAGLP